MNTPREKYIILKNFYFCALKEKSPNFRVKVVLFFFLLQCSSQDDFYIIFILCKVIVDPLLGQFWNTGCMFETPGLGYSLVTNCTYLRTCVHFKHLVVFFHQGPEKKMKDEQEDMERKLREEEEKGKKKDTEGDDEEDGDEEDDEEEDEQDDETDEDTGTEEVDDSGKAKDEL